MEELPGLRRRIILDFRSSGKTTLNCECHTIQWHLNYPLACVAIFQYKLEKAETILKAIKEHYLTNGKFRALFPEYGPPADKINDFGTKASFDIWKIEQKRPSPRRERSVMTASLDAGLSGYHFEIMKFSDVVETENTETLDQCQKTIDKFGKAEFLLTGKNYWIDVEGTRYHFGDLYGDIIKKTKQHAASGKRFWDIYARGIYVPELPENKVREYSVEELALPDKKDDKGKPVYSFPKELEKIFGDIDMVMQGEIDDPSNFACSRGDQKILMADYSQKDIKDVSVGDKVIGWKFNGTRTRIEEAEVLATGTVDDAEICEIITEDGFKTYQTADHKWYYPTTRDYRKIKPGQQLWRCYQPFQELSPEQEKDAIWLAGFFDGEGYLSKSGCPGLAQSLSHNPETCKKLEDVLRRLEFNFNCSLARPEKGRRAQQYNIRGGKSEYIRFWNVVLRHAARRDKFLRKFQDAFKKPTHSPGRPNNEGLHGERTMFKVISMEPVERGPVYWLQTTTGNYIVSGFLSSNSQMRNNPIGGRGGVADFPVVMKDDKYERPSVCPRAEYEAIAKSYSILSVDFAETVSERANWTVFAHATIDRVGRTYIDMLVREKWQPHESVKYLLSICNKLRPTYLVMEEVNFTRGLRVALEREWQTNPSNYKPSIRWTKRPANKEKEERIRLTLQQPYKTGDIRFVKDKITDTAWAGLIQELREFPRSTSDDILDAISDIFDTRDWFGKEYGKSTVPNEYVPIFDDPTAVTEFIIATGNLPMDTGPFNSDSTCIVTPDNLIESYYGNFRG